jgi:hypothetical protein
VELNLHSPIRLHGVLLNLVQRQLYFNLPNWTLTIPITPNILTLGTHCFQVRKLEYGEDGSILFHSVTQERDISGKSFFEETHQL